MLAELVRTLLPNCQVYGAPSEERALKFIETYDPQLIFVELKGESLDGLSFTRRLRRSDLSCRQCPVVIVTAEATAAAIVSARDAGVHEFLRRPYTMGDLKKRIDAMSGRPRDWIEAISYVGPDRRRFNSADYKGPRKRRTDGGSPIAQKIGQALRIVLSAAGALDSDPKQAGRALQAQARNLAEICAGREPLKRLEAVALSLEAYLLGPARTQGLSREQIETFLAQLQAAAPAESLQQAA
jgi:DNA-binding response OmpR family regulator